MKGATIIPSNPLRRWLSTVAWHQLLAVTPTPNPFPSDLNHAITEFLTTHATRLTKEEWLAKYRQAIR